MTLSRVLMLLSGLLACSVAISQPKPAAAEDDADVPRAAASTWRHGVDRLQLELGHFGDNPRADWTATARATPFVGWQPSRAWELRLGARLEHDRQSGGTADFEASNVGLGESYLRYRGGDTRLTLGAQTVIWGRADAVPLIDRVSRVDLRRGPLDELQERRLPQPLLRWEQGIGEDYRLDAVLIPSFTAARLPDRRSAWHPVDRHDGRIIGVPAGALPPTLVRASRIVEDDDGTGGLAARFTRAGEPFDWGLTVARTRQSLPYFRVEPATLTLRALHPYQSFVAADAELVADGATWRAELAYTDGKLLTDPIGAAKTARGLDFIGAVEFFPGGKNTRVNLQLVSLNHRVDGPVLELKHYHGVNGEAEASFDQGRWKASMRFSVGLNVRDRYLAPKLSFVGWEPHELFVAARYFSGEDRTIGGFFRDNRMVAVGIKTRF